MVCMCDGLEFLKRVILGVITITFIATALCGCNGAQNSISRTGIYFDTVIQVTIYDSGKTSDGEACLEGCFELAKRYEDMLSPTVEGSDIWNINHSEGKAVEVSNETAGLLATALYYCDMTNGKVDLTVETVSSLWDFHADSGQVPDSVIIADAVSHVDYRNVEINGSSVTLHDPEASVGLGFIAKGYIADKMKEYLLSQGVKSALINLGGNLLAIGSKPDGSSFNFGIQKPFDAQGTPITTLSVSDGSLVSSGVYERYFYENGILYHHLLDPDTGYPIQNNLLGVTILSDSSTVGDALSTTCFVLGLEDGMRLIETLEDVEAVFITDDYELHYSSGSPPTPPYLP